MKFFNTTFIFLCLSTSLFCQTDIGSWTSVQLNYKANKLMTLKLRPIIRHNDNLSALNNTSNDFSIHLQHTKEWKSMILWRHFFMPDQGDRQFLFFDVSHSKSLNSSFNLSNRLRYHFAMDLNRRDPEFLRYQPTLTYKKINKINPFAAFDIFYRLTDERTTSGVRYILGSTFTLSPKVKINVQYWRQKAYGNLPLPDAHLFITNLLYTLEDSILTKN